VDGTASPFFPKSHGKPRAKDRRVLYRMILFSRNGLRWCDAPRDFAATKTVYKL
jgi:transposase